MQILGASEQPRSALHDGIKGMMLPRQNRKWVLRAAGAALGVLIMTSYADGIAKAEDDNLPDAKLFRSILHSLGLRRGDDGIDYRERSPLVIPPSRDLPQPATTTLEKNPAWPHDPDVKRRKEAKKEKDERYTGDSAVASRLGPLRPDQMRPGGAGGNTVLTTPDNRYKDENAVLRPSELGYKGGLLGAIFDSNKEDYATFTGEAPRTSLIEPPVGYRTPSPTQPYGVGKEKAAPAPTDRLIPVR